MRRGREPPDPLAAEGAAEATSLWSLGQYDAALQTLQRLEGMLPDDKVQLNTWVAGFYADSSMGIQEVTARFAAWLESHGPGDSATHSGYGVAALNYAILLFVQQQHASALAVLEPLYAQVEALHGGLALCLCVLLLEIYLTSSQLAKAAAVLQYLQASTAPELPLRPTAADEAGQADQAASSSGGDGGGGDGLQQQLAEQQQGEEAAGSWEQEQLGSPEHRQLQQSTQHHQPQPDQPRQQPDQPGPVSQQQQQQQQQQVEDAGAGSDACSINLPIVSRCTSDFMQQVRRLVEQQGGQLVGVDVTALLHLYKARLAMACNNYRAAKKEVRSLLVLQPSSAAAVLLKAQLELLRQQPRKALKTLGPLMAVTQSCTSRSRLQLLNVLAAVHHQLGKHNVAALYLHAAMLQHERDGQQQLGQPSQQKQQQPEQQQQQQPKQSQASAGQPANLKAAVAAAGADATSVAPCPATPRNSRWLLPDMSDALAYNMGLQQLALHNWQAALDCFDAASSKFYNQPQLWLRMAEASINWFNEQRDEQQQQQQQQQQIELLMLPQERLQQPQQSPPLSRQQQQPPPQRAQEGQPCSAVASADDTGLLVQAASQLSTGLTLLQQQQAEAAKQAETALSASLAEGGGQAAAAAAGQNGLPLGGAAVNTGRSSSASFAGRSQHAAAAHEQQQQQLHSLLDVGHSNVLPHDLLATKQSLLANSAYVQLLLDKPCEALSAAQALLACSSSSQQQHYLGTCYAAEALCLLGRPDEATEQLQSHMALFMDTGVAGGSSGAINSAHTASAAPSAAAAASAAGLAAGTPQQDGVSIKSDDDGSCTGARGPGSHQQLPGSSVAPQQQAALLCNMAALLAAQGDLQESRRHAALAAQQDPSNAVARQLLGMALTEDVYSGQR